MTAEDRAQYLQAFRNDIAEAEHELKEAEKEVQHAQSRRNSWADGLARVRAAYESALAEQNQAITAQEENE